mmetsp:Transcript_30409/g.54162  ORF Transcript_30409/g.54162 Transcript_30409/m.54162 type:complete len:260 (+) Transcript_30409:1-780(+)
MACSPPRGLCCRGVEFAGGLRCRGVEFAGKSAAFCDAIAFAARASRLPSELGLGEFCAEESLGDPGAACEHIEEPPLSEPLFTSLELCRGECTTSLEPCRGDSGANVFSNLFSDLCCRKLYFSSEPFRLKEVCLGDLGDTSADCACLCLSVCSMCLGDTSAVCEPPKLFLLSGFRISLAPHLGESAIVWRSSCFSDLLCATCGGLKAEAIVSLCMHRGESAIVWRSKDLSGFCCATCGGRTSLGIQRGESATAFCSNCL